MENTDFVEKFEALWFFSNVLSSSKSQYLSSVCNGVAEKTQIDLRKYCEPCTQAEPISIQVKTNTQQTPISDTCVHQFLSAGIEIYSKTVVKSEPIKIQSDSPSRRRKGRRKRCLKNSKRRVLREIDLGLSDGDVNDDDDENAGFDVNRVYGSWLVIDDEKCRRSSGKIGSENQNHHVMKMMPALNDGLAMKQHLKSWAYAVACSVK